MAMNNLTTSPSSSPTSVAVHQQEEKGNNKRRQDLALDESEHCASNPQQGTASHSSLMEFKRTAVAQEEVSYSSQHHHQNLPRTGRKEWRQKRPPRLIDTRPNMKIPATHKDNRKLFVGGLPPDGTFLDPLACYDLMLTFNGVVVTSEEFYEFFVRYGGILDSVVMFDKATQRCRGFGFVTFQDPQVTADLLRLGGGEEATSEGKGSQNGYLEMRGKVIEIKRAQPKSTLAGGSSPSDKSTSGSSHSRRGSESRKLYSPCPTPSDDYYDYNPSAAKYPPPNMSYEQHDHMHRSQHQNPPLSHQQHMINHRAFVPTTPISCYNDTSGVNAAPMTPQQAVLDLAHHMLFYSQLLATPSLMSQHHGMVSPMMSPGMMGVQAYNDYFQPFYDADRSNNVSPVPPTLRKVPEGESFEIGDCKFYRETSLSPTLDSSQPSLRPSEEKR